LGIVVFVGVTVLIYYVTTKFLLPFIIGAWASFIAGILASKIAALIFALKFGHYYMRNVSQLRDIPAILDYFKDFLNIGAANYLIVIIGSLAFGIFMVVASLIEDTDE
jgi:hypothetical protein